MKRLEQLPEITEKALGGLTAGQSLKLRVEKSATNPTPARRATAAWVPALCCALVLAIALGVGFPSLRQQDAEPLIASQPAGSTTAGSERSLLDLEGDVTIRQSTTVPSYRSIWATGDSGSFPLIGMEGKYYRMLTMPQSISTSLLGERLGTVAEYTTEPSLSGTDVILSNVAAQNSDVYAISGMGSTLVAAQVNGEYCVFQRVSFNGFALRGSETLADTLQLAGHITAMELSDVGTIANAATCESLFATLVSCASYESSGSLSGNQSLLIALDNGLTVQLTVKNDKLAACGTWSCPEFFEAFAAAVQ